VNDRVADKIRSAVGRVAAERGELHFAALVQREGTPPDMWDLVLVAPWVTNNKREVLERLFSELRRSLSRSDFLEIARIVLLDRIDPSREPIPRGLPITSDLARATGPGRFLGVEARDVYYLIADGALQKS
jgi:hypothetical protein